LIDSVTITEPTQVVVNQFITAATCGLCDGSLSVAPSGGAAPYTVVWSTGSVLDTITSLCPGFYSVQITDFVGCSQSIVMPLNSLNAPTLTTSSVPLLCNAACNATATVVAAGGILPYTYLWNDPGAQTTDVATALCAGTYFVQVTGGGCVSFASVEITDPAPIGFSLANSVDPLCNGNSNGSVAVIPFGGTLPYTFSWTGSGSVSDTASGLSAGVYTVTVTDANGCTSSQSNTLVNPDSLIISNVPTPASCNTIADGAIDVTVGGGTPGYTYQWSGGSALTTQDLTGILIGSYDITVTDTNGCTITDNIIVTSTVTVNAVAGNDTAFCEPGTMLLSASGSSANVINYQWFQIPA
ncbi:MAG: SprB repeat-containing protein, partial [Bacteroidota bacterium]|nr:SprB repeat-containing protein [Bacteroidota bacterium]